MELKSGENVDKGCASFEEALSKTGFGMFNYTLILLVGVVFACIVFETVGVNFIIPISQCDLDMTTTDKGILSSIGFAGIILSSHLWGFLADTRGRKRIMLPCMFIAFGITFISSFAKSFWLFAFLRLLNGFL